MQPTNIPLNPDIEEAMKRGQHKTFIYQGSEVLAWQQQNGSTQTMAWEHRDVSNASVNISGLPEGSKGAELEPLGMDAGTFHLIAPPPSNYRPPLKEARDYPGFADSTSSQCRVDGIDMPCGMVSSETAVHCPNNDCGPQVINGELVPFIAYDDGSSSFDHAGESIGYYPDGVPKGGRKTRRKADDSFDHAYNPQNTVIGFDTLWEDLADIIKDGTCRSFIADLVGTLQEQTGKKAHAFSVEGMLAELAKNPKNGTNGIGLYDINQGGRKVLIGEGGWDDNGKGYANISEIISTGGDTPSAHRDLARMLLHEIIHTATKFKSGFERDGGYTDVEVASAIFEITGDKKDDPRARENNPLGSHPTTVGGVIFNRALQKYCK
jgi:hypothetical protein